MKITEPKTPYAGTYDPAEDEEEISALNANDIVVDELDAAEGKKPPKDDDIPGLDIGEPEASLEPTHTPESEKRVMVDTDMTDEGRHGEETADMSEDERAKHRQFEEMRRKHYEMKNVRNLLGYVFDLIALYGSPELI
jgi:protein phosphatase inhibitor 2